MAPPVPPAAIPQPPVIDSDPPPASARGGGIAKLSEPWEDDDKEDGPTMAGQPLMPDLPLRDDVVNPRPHSPLASTAYQTSAVDKDAETMAHAAGAGDLPRLGDPADADETTRAVSRDEMMRHQDAHVVVGPDAMGDEATLAVAPGALAELGIDSSRAPLGDRRPQHPSQQDLPVGHDPLPRSAPAFPAAPGFAPNGCCGAPPPSWQGEPSPSYRNPPQQAINMQGYDPMLPHGPESYPGMPGSVPNFAAHGSQPQQPVYNPNPNAPTAGGPYPMGMQQQQPWMQQQPMQPMYPAPQAKGAASPFAGLAQKLTPQIIMLIVIGTVCLAIFVTGIVLFFTTNFNNHP